jgi:hypothetical protein
MLVCGDDRSAACFFLKLLIDEALFISSCNGLLEYLKLNSQVFAAPNLILPFSVRDYPLPGKL